MSRYICTGHLIHYRKSSLNAIFRQTNVHILCKNANFLLISISHFIYTSLKTRAKRIHVINKIRIKRGLPQYLQLLTQKNSNICTIKTLFKDLVHIGSFHYFPRRLLVKIFRTFRS